MSAKDPGPQSICPAPRRSWACESCRAKKTRCLPSEQDGTCESHSRQRKLPQSHHSRVTAASCLPHSEPSATKVLHEQLGEKHRDFSHTETENDDENDDIISGLCKSSDNNEVDYSSNLQAIHHRIFGWLFSPQQAIDAPAPRIQQPMSGAKPSEQFQKITSSEVDTRVRQYRALHSYFPFVSLPSNSNVQSLQKTHPFLLLGLLCAMSVHDVTLNLQLNTQFKRAISERVLIESEMSLDIVQGLLVYIAWYPFHLHPRSRQIFQYLQMAITMVVDLHWDTVTEGYLGFSSSSSETPMQNAEALKAQKQAYLGCIYLSSLIAMCMRKQNKFEYTVYTDHCISEFSENIDNQNDQLIAVYMRLQKIAEESLKIEINMESINTEINPITCIEALKIQLESAASSIKLHIQKCHPLHIAYRYSAMKIHAIHLEKHSSGFRSNANENNLIQRGLCNDVLSNCLTQTKLFFEAFLSVPTLSYLDFSAGEWGCLIDAVKIMSSLCFAVPSVPEWDDTSAREKAQFGLYLESLCFRMQELSTVKTGSDGALSMPDHFMAFRTVLQIVRDTYEEKAAALALERENALNVSSNVEAEAWNLHCPALGPGIEDTDYWAALQGYDLKSDPLFSDAIFDQNQSYMQSLDTDFLEYTGFE